MRIKVTTQIEHSMLLLFRAAASVHGNTLADALELGVREVLRDIDPESVLAGDIERRAAELEEQRKLLAGMRLLSPEQKRLKQFEKRASELEKLRIERFEKEKDTLRKELRRGDANRSRILWDYQFQSWREAVAWFRNRLEADAAKTIEVKP